MRFGGTYHRELLDLELLCRLNSPRHPEEVAGAVLLLKKGTRRSSTAKQGRQVLERRCVGGRGRSLKDKGALEQVVNRESIFHIKREPGQVLQDQTMSRIAAYPDAGGYNFLFS